MMEDRLKDLEKEVVALKARNARVEADKAWETSWARVLTLTVVTYIVASAVMWMIGVQNVWTSALIPTVGYFLSTQSLPMVKSWWLSRRKA